MVRIRVGVNVLEEPLAALERVAQRDQLLEQVASQCLVRARARVRA